MGYFNTSHVTVYHSRASFCNSFNIHFNTSHVTVYQQRNCTGSTRDIISIHLMLLFITVWMYHPCSRCSISIHLMLLFINKSECIICRNKRFQYISCYCLSPSEHPIFLPVFISIHLMLLFIGELVLLCSC